MISGQYACILTFHISKAALPYNIMTVVSFEVEKRDVKYIENPMLTNSNTQRWCKLNGDFTNRKHTDTSYWHQIVEQLLQFTGKVTLPSNPISSELDISRCSSEEGSGSTNENLDHAIVFLRICADPWGSLSL